MNFNDTFTKLVQKLDGWADQLILILPNLLVGFVILAIFWLIAGQAKKYSQRLLKRIFRSEEVAWLAAVALYIVIMLAGIAAALGIMGLDKTVTSLLAGAGIVGLALALAFQDLGQNVLAGIYISLRRTIRTGDIIESNDKFGTIHDINLRSLHMHTPQGQLVVIPNREVFQNTLTKFSTGHRRIDLAVGISYGDDLDKVRDVTIAALNDMPERQRHRPVELFYEEFGDSSINFVVRFWIDFRRQREFLHARSEAIRRIKRAYDENDITIPFPIRTLDFGIVGGEKLSTSLQNAGWKASGNGEAGAANQS